MIYEKIDNLIAGSMNLVHQMKVTFGEGSPNHRDAVRLLNLQREVKTEMTRATKGDENTPGIQLPNDDAELAILNAMYHSRKTALKKFAKAAAANDPLAPEAIYTAKYEMQWLKQFLPDLDGDTSEDDASEEDIRNEAMCVIKAFVELKTIEDPNFNIKSLQRFTRDIIAKVKEKYPDADGGIISGCIQKYVRS